jgi:hypothetical protein
MKSFTIITPILAMIFTQFVQFSVSIKQYSVSIDTSEHSLLARQDVSTANCVDSFQSFAYQAPLRSGEEETVYPTTPWQIVSSLPPHNLEGYETWTNPLVNVSTTREVASGDEIWTLGKVIPQNLELPNKTHISVYNTASGTWESISADVGDTHTFVSSLFVTPDGEVWGLTDWDGDFPPELQQVPVLSRFNETTRQFEFAPGVLEIPVTFRNTPFDNVRIIMDDTGVFWIFNVNNSIYRYDPALQTTELQTRTTEDSIADVALAPDGSIYFGTFSTSFRVNGSQLYQFIPAAREILPVALPDEQWPMYYGLLFDPQGRLWLGAVGYRDINGEWQLIHSSPELYFEHESTFVWQSPTLRLASSDGRLWFTRYQDTGTWIDGSAWYDPETNEGCMFTHVRGIVVEDSEQQLWLLANGNLYRSSSAER